MNSAKEGEGHLHDSSYVSTPGPVEEPWWGGLRSRLALLLSRYRSEVPIALLLCFFLAMRLINLGANSSGAPEWHYFAHGWTWDEGIFAEIGKNLAFRGKFEIAQGFQQGQYQRGVYLVPGPLTMTLNALVIRLFGVGVVQVRMVSVLLSLGCILLVYVIGRQLASRAVGLIAALVLGANYLFLLLSRVGLTDVPLVFFFLLTMYAYLRSRASPNRKRWAAVMGLSAAMATLSKYSGVLVVPIIALYYVVETLVTRRIAWQEIGTAVALFVMPLAAFFGAVYFTYPEGIEQIVNLGAQQVGNIGVAETYTQFVREYPLLSLLGGLGLLAALVRMSHTTLILVPWALTMFCWFILSSGSLKYSLILVPIFALLGGNLVHLAYSAVESSRGRRKAVSMAGLGVVAALTASCVVLHLKDGITELTRYDDYSQQQVADFLNALPSGTSVINTELNITYLTGIPHTPPVTGRALGAGMTPTQYLSTLGADLMVLGPYAKRYRTTSYSDYFFDFARFLGEPVKSAGPYDIYDLRGMLPQGPVPEALPGYWSVIDGDGEVSEALETPVPGSKAVRLTCLGPDVSFQYDEEGTWDLSGVTHLVFWYKAERYTPSKEDSLRVSIESTPGNEYMWQTVTGVPIPTEWERTVLGLRFTRGRWELGAGADYTAADRIKMRMVSGVDQDYDLLVGYLYFIGDSIPPLGGTSPQPTPEPQGPQR